MANTLLVRYHRIGDGIIVLPLIMSLAHRYPNDTFTVLTNARFMSLAETMPSNVRFIPMVTRKSTGFLRGPIFKIRKQRFLRQIPKLLNRYDKVALLQHDVTEQKMLEYLRKQTKDIQFSMTGEDEFIDEKRLLNRCEDGMTMIGQHKKALAELGYTDLGVMINPDPIRKKDTGALFHSLRIDPRQSLVAISPFSKEKSKIYPLDKMEKVVAGLARKGGYQLLIFGGGAREEKTASQWASAYPNVVSLINRISFEEEMKILAKCSVSLAMDSANLHFSAFLGVPVVSIWGATQPQNGYFPESVPVEYCITKGLPCQPCSMFGQTQCTQSKPYDCLDIDPQTVIDKIEHVLAMTKQ